jgi:Uma2 family endonuclease
VQRIALSQITWQDVQQLPDDGHRREAIEGELYVTPAPTPRHQDIVLRLAIRLREILVEPGLGRLWVALIGVEFPDTGEGVQPDIVFASTARRDRIVEAGIRGAPDLVVEVLSPATATRDRGVKRKLYERQGVSEYWIVDPESEAVEVWTFGAAGKRSPAGEPRATVSHRRFNDRVPVGLADAPIGEIDLAEVFRAD